MAEIYERHVGSQFVNDTLGDGPGAVFMGPDHLLVVTRLHYTERYTRIAYRDIQALVWYRVWYREWMSAAMGMLTFFLAVVAFATSNLAGAFFVLFLTLLFLALTVFLLIYGRTAKAHLKTAVQEVPLPSLYQIGIAERFLDKLRARIMTHQQALIAPNMQDAPTLAAPESDTLPMETDAPLPMETEAPKEAQALPPVTP